MVRNVTETRPVISRRRVLGIAVAVTSVLADPQSTLQMERPKGSRPPFNH
jgi:hypothetical protein